MSNALDGEDPRCKQANVSFGMRGDNLVPDDISAHLGIEPSRSYTKGQEFIAHTGQNGVGTRSHPCGVWILSTEGVVESTNPERHALSLLERLEPLRDKLVPFLEDPDYYVAIWIWWESRSHHGGFTMSSTVFQRLCALCNELNFTFISGPEDDEEK